MGKERNEIIGEDNIEFLNGFSDDGGNAKGYHRSLSAVIQSASTSSLYSSMIQQPQSTPVVFKFIDWFKSDKYMLPFMGRRIGPDPFAKPGERYRKVSIQCDAILHNRFNGPLLSKEVKRSDSDDQSRLSKLDKNSKHKTVKVSDFDIVMTAPISM